MMLANQSVEPTATRRRLDALRVLSDRRSPCVTTTLGGVAVAHFCRSAACVRPTTRTTKQQ